MNQETQNQNENVVVAKRESKTEPKNVRLAESLPVDPGELNICIGCE